MSRDLSRIFVFYQNPHFQFYLHTYNLESYVLDNHNYLKWKHQNLPVSKFNNDFFYLLSFPDKKAKTFPFNNHSLHI